MHECLQFGRQVLAGFLGKGESTSPDLPEVCFGFHAVHMFLCMI